MSRDLGPTGLDVSRETLDRLSHYVELIKKWNPAINLVSKSTLPSIWERHIGDSLQVTGYIQSNQRIWADLGSGGGLPGLVVAIAAKEMHPNLLIKLVEVDQRKSVFLRTVARELDLNVQVCSEKIEALDPINADVLSARALASLTLLCGFAKRHLKPDGICIFPKGAQSDLEVAEARKYWTFSLDQAASITDPQAKLLILRAIEHV